jgi:hypothetical protein
MKMTSTLGTLFFTAAIASAQFPLLQQPQQPPRPALSPYYNLLRNNAPAYQNYYGLVQPQIQAQNQINQLQQQLTGLQNASMQNYYPGTGAELATGKSVGFFTHRGWFNNSGGYGRNNTLTGQYSTAGNNALYTGGSPAGSNLPLQNAPNANFNNNNFNNFNNFNNNFNNAPFRR